MERWQSKMNINTVLINWYNKNKRDLPWRNTNDPYLIWLSEIILQQTRIEQGLSYYQKFAENYPDVASLAKTKEDDVLKLWQGLGYYSRARNLHKAAKQIITEFSGKFPSDYHSIKSLKGVGDYTAAAISSFAYNLKYPVVDGNVFRFLSRYFGVDTPIDTSAGKKEFTGLAENVMQTAPPAIFNQAIMEFGSRQCRPSNPDCENCPLNISCVSFKNKIVNLFPVKKNKTKIRNRFFNYLVISQKNTLYFKKRIEKDIWEGLHDFPLIETKNRINESGIIKSDEWKKTFDGRRVTLHSISPEYKHVLSHQLIFAKFYEVTIEKPLIKQPAIAWKKVKGNSVKKYAVPKLIQNYLETRELKLSKIISPNNK